MKAENLLRLQAAGFPVPPFQVVTDVSKIDLSFSKALNFAVRSSCSTEDGTEHSYAGQFETFLNVPAEDVPAKVGLVLASASKSSVKAYEDAKGLQSAIESEASRKGAKNRMRVIIQEMIEADFAGVVFTSNPLGLMNERVLVVGRGLGSGIVDEKTEAATYYYHKEDKIWYSENTRAAEGFSAENLERLMELCLLAEETFQKPMDLEFAVKESQVYILQARPITTLPDGEMIILDNSNIVESYPGVSLPLTISFVKEIYYRIFRSSLLHLTNSEVQVSKLDDALKDMVEAANGRIYYRISNWYDVLLILPFHKKIIPVWQEMMGVENKTLSEGWQSKVSLKTRFIVAWNFLFMFLVCPHRMKKLNRYFKGKLPEYKSQIREARKTTDLFRLYRSLLDELSEKWDITLGNDLYSFVFTALSNKLCPGRLEGVQKLESMKPVRALEKVWNIGKKHGFDSEKCRRAEEKYIELYGDRCLMELKLETQTYRTNPELFHEYLIRQNGQAFQTLKESTYGLESGTENKSSCKNKIASLVVKRASIGIRNREISRLNRSRIFGMAREIMLKIGQLLTEDGIIPGKEDVFYLYESELKEIIFDLNGSTNRPVDYKSLVEERKEYFKALKQLPEYSRLIYKGKVYDKAPAVMENDVHEKEYTLLHGTPCSQGLVRAEALVVTEVNDTIDAEGKILVTKSTDPGWVFLIYKAKGVISEKGSLLSHTAIISRELGKPSVVGIKNATQIIKTGDIIELDSMNGTVRFVDRIL